MLRQNRTAGAGRRGYMSSRSARARARQSAGSRTGAGGDRIFELIAMQAGRPAPPINQRLSPFRNAAMLLFVTS